MSHWASGITVVTCLNEAGQVRGMTASSFSSLSLTPPLVLVCVVKSTTTHALIEAERRFAIHILDHEMEELSNRCAGFRGDDAHLLHDVAHHTEATGAPVLDDALGWLDCSLWQAYD